MAALRGAAWPGAERCARRRPRQLCIGIYWPVIASHRSIYVPESVRATTTSLLRIPLNVMVAYTLLHIGAIPERLVYVGCTVGLLVVTLSQLALQGVTPRADGVEKV